MPEDHSTSVSASAWGTATSSFENIGFWGNEIGADGEGGGALKRSSGYDCE